MTGQKRDILGACLLSGLVLALTYEQGKVLHLEWLGPLLWCIPLLLLWRQRIRYPSTSIDSADPDLAPHGILFAGLVLYLFSGMTLHPWFAFLNWTPREGKWLGDPASGLTQWMLVSALILPMVIRPPRRLGGWLALLLAMAIAGCWTGFFRSTGGDALYNDDHASFLFRLHLFGRGYPQLVHYCPYWNGGVMEYTGLLTGTNAPGLLFWPFWAWCDPTAVQPYAIAILFFVLVPGLAVWSLRLMQGTWPAALVAGLLTLMATREYTLWLLNYGTLGANFTSALAIPVSAALYRIVVLRRTDWPGLVTLIMGMSFLVLWPPGVLTGLVLCLSVLPWVFSLDRRRWIVLVLCALAVVLFSARELLFILSQGDAGSQTWIAPVGGADAGTWDRVRAGFVLLRQHLREINPLILFFGLAGMLCAGGGRDRRWFVPALAGLGALSAWGHYYSPSLQLERMVIPLCFLAIIPAARGFGAILDTRSPRWAPVRAALLGLLILHGWSAARVYAGKGGESYGMVPPAIRELASWIRLHTPPDERIMLAGDTSHDYEGGHVMFLPILLGREMTSSQYQHGQKVDPLRGSPPDTPSALDAHVQTYAVGHIVTVSDAWVRYLRSQPDRYEACTAIQGDDSLMTVFRVRHPTSRFLQGSGTIVADLNRITVQPADPEGEVVIRYNWLEGLRTEPPAEAFPLTAPNGSRLIGIRAHGQREVVLHYSRWL